MQTFQLEGKVREQVGRRSAMDARAAESIPCVLYGDGENIHFEVAKTAIKSLVFSSNVYKVHITINGSTHECLMREIQFDKLTDAVMHIDFFKLNPAKKVTCVVPVKAVGQSVGVRAGGKLVQRLRKLTIKALPANLVDRIEVDITELDVNKTIRIGDISIPNVEVLGSKSIPIMTVASPRALRAAAEGTEQKAGAEAPKEAPKA